MKIQQLRTVILAQADPVVLQASLDLIRKGQPLTAVQSGTVAYPNNADGTSFVASFEMAAPPQVFFDGVNFTVFLFYIAG